jgi:hypothetical protein
VVPASDGCVLVQSALPGDVLTASERDGLVAQSRSRRAYWGALLKIVKSSLGWG